MLTRAVLQTKEEQQQDPRALAKVL